MKKMNIMMTLRDVLRVIQINARLEVHVLNVLVHQKVNVKIGKKQKFVNWMVLLMVLVAPKVEARFVYMPIILVKLDIKR
jgi:hypothetical protein